MKIMTDYLFLDIKTLSVTYEEYDALYKAAVDLATKAHKGQKDRGGDDYINHPKRVAEKCDTILQKITALLHDVVEDSKYTLDDLRKHKTIGKYPQIINAVECLTHKKGESYGDYINKVMTNPTALCVKIRDLEDNLNCLRLPDMTEKDWDRMKKYYNARKTLIECYKKYRYESFNQ